MESGTAANGYTLDENNYYIINEEEAEAIRLAYDLYINSEMGQTALLKELKSRGIVFSADRLRKMLSDVGYTGETYPTTVWVGGKRTRGYDITYPAIIDTATFEKAEKKRAKNNSNCHRGKIYYFGKRIIKCPVCGHSYMGYKTSKIYCCLAYKHDNKDIEKCYNGNTINIIPMDSILWYDAKGEYLYFRRHLKDGEIEKYTEQKKVLTQKIAASESTIAKSTPKIERIGELYAEGVYSKEKKDTELAKIKALIAAEENNRIAYQNEIKKIDQLVQDMQATDDWDAYIQLEEHLNDINNIVEMYNLVHRFITYATVEKVDMFGSKQTRKVVVGHLDGDSTTYYTRYRGNKMQFWMEPELVGISEEEAIASGKRYLDITHEVKIIFRELGRNPKRDYKLKCVKKEKTNFTDTFYYGKDF